MSADLAIPLRRGFVLLALHGQYPLPLARPMFERAVMPFYNAEDGALDRDVAYLTEKGLLVTESSAMMGRKIVTFRLTARGCDVVDGSVEEPGVEIARG